MSFTVGCEMSGASLIRQPTMFARIGVMCALNRHHVWEFDPAPKEHHWGRRKLKRDQ
jgi:hypothetical protein